MQPARLGARTVSVPARRGVSVTRATPRAFVRTVRLVPAPRTETRVPAGVGMPSARRRVSAIVVRVPARSLRGVAASEQARAAFAGATWAFPPPRRTGSAAA